MTVPDGWQPWGETPDGKRYRRRRGASTVVVVLGPREPYDGHGRRESVAAVTITAHSHALVWRTGSNMAKVRTDRLATPDEVRDVQLAFDMTGFRVVDVSETPPAISLLGHFHEAKP